MTKPCSELSSPCKQLSKDDIKQIIPHREPMLLIDRCEGDPSDEKSMFGFYTVRGDEFFLQGHFPGNPVVPGVILCEMMAQTCCPLLEERDTMPLFTSLNNVKFRGMVKPGDEIKFHCTLTRKNGVFYFASGKGFVNDKMVVAADLSFAAIKNESKQETEK